MLLILTLIGLVSGLDVLQITSLQQFARLLNWYKLCAQSYSSRCELYLALTNVDETDLAMFAS